MWGKEQKGRGLEAGKDGRMASEVEVVAQQCPEEAWKSALDSRDKKWQCQQDGKIMRWIQINKTQEQDI